MHNVQSRHNCTVHYTYEDTVDTAVVLEQNCGEEHCEGRG